MLPKKIIKKFNFICRKKSFISLLWEMHNRYIKKKLLLEKNKRKFQKLKNPRKINNNQFENESKKSNVLNSILK